VKKHSSTLLKEEKLAAKLRENLKRRKTQIKQRAAKNAGCSKTTNKNIIHITGSLNCQPRNTRYLQLPRC